MKCLVSIALVALLAAAVLPAGFGAVPREVAPPTPPGPDDPADVAALQHAKGLRARQDAKGNVSEVWLFREPDTGAMAHLAALRNVRELRVEGIEDAAETDKVLAVAASCPWWPAVEILSLNRSKVSADGLRVLRRLHNIRGLCLRCTDITTDGLAHVARLRTLESLRIGGNRLTADGVKHLAGLRNLELLDLAETDLTDGEVANIAGLTRLKVLILADNAITDAAMPHLKGLTRLEFLTLTRTVVTGRGMEALGGLRHLRQVDVEGCGIAYDEWPEGVNGPAGLEDRGYRRPADERAAVAALRRATHCTLWFSPGGRLGAVEATEPYPDLFNDSIFDRLATLPELESLRMDGCDSVTPAGLKRLAGLPRLDSLEILGCKAFTARELKCVLALKHIRKLGFVPRPNWVECRDPDNVEALAVLAEIKGLRELAIGGLICSADDFKYIGRLHDLESLALGAVLPGGPAVEEALAGLSSLTKLRTLDLQAFGVRTEDGLGSLRWIEPLTRLEHLTLQGGDTIEESELVHLRGMTELRELPNVRDITDADIKYLEGMKHLESLSLICKHVTPEGYERLRKALPKTKIYWDAPGTSSYEIGLPHGRRRAPKQKTPGSACRSGGVDLSGLAGLWRRPMGKRGPGQCGRQRKDESGIAACRRGFHYLVLLLRREQVEADAIHPLWVGQLLGVECFDLRAQLDGGGEAV